jgi:hypothetical protein
MAATRETDNTLVKPLEGAIIRRYTTGAAVEAGEAVYIDGSGYIQPCNGGAVATNFCIGVSIQDIASGDSGAVVTYGPLLCMQTATPGAIIYTSDTAGELAETAASTYDTVIGVAESATILFVMPWMVQFA